jgi:hypothetical protein
MSSKGYLSTLGLVCLRPLVLMSGWTGVDFSQYGFDEPIRYSRQDAQTSALEAFTMPIRTGYGRCGKSPSTPLSAVVGR